MAGIAEVFAFLFGTRSDAARVDDELVAATVEAIVDRVEPRIRLDPGYRKKLAGAVEHTLAYLRQLRDQLPQEILTLARGRWQEDPHLNAFFANADEVRAFMGRSHDLRAMLAEVPTAPEAYALLGMKLEKKHVFAPKLVDGALRQDVAQTSVSFSGHRLLAPQPTLETARREIGQRLFLRLAQVALKGILESNERAMDLEQQKGYLQTRLRFLELAKDGMEGIVQDPTTIDAQIRTVRRELKETVDAFIEVKSGIATLDRYTDRIVEVLRNPQQHLKIVQLALRVNRLGMEVAMDEDEPAQEIVLHELHLDEVRGIICLVRCPREEMPPPEDLVAAAARTL